LGRGFRGAAGKSFLTVVDFVCHQHDKFRFDIPLRAMTGVPRGRLLHAVENGFPQMPGGSQIVLDRVAEERVIDSIKSQLSLTTKALVSDVRENIPDGTNALEYRLSDYHAESRTGLPAIY